MMTFRTAQHSLSGSLSGRMIGVVVAALAAVLLPVVSATSAGADDIRDGDIKQRFAADSGDNCRRGTTEGILIWRGGPGFDSVVTVEGVVADEFGNSVCVPGSDGRYSVAIFSAFSRGVLVDRDVRAVDNGERRFAFDLIGREPAHIDVVTVQVCRHPADTLPYSYCGVKQTYRRPIP